MSNTTRHQGLLIFALITFGGSWLTAAVVASAWRADQAPMAIRLLVASAIYALSMGWQPLLAVYVVRRWVDHEPDIGSFLRQVRPRFTAIAIGMPLLIAVLAMAIATLTSTSSDASTALEADQRYGASIATSPALVIAVLTALLLVWVQALAEEVGWRGYFLVRFRQAIGPRAGLALHGVVWGIWYAPAFLLVDRDLARSTLESIGFVLTCTLLGALLGWLRLVSKSVAPTTISNGVLTLTAGLPFLLQGQDPGVRSAVYGPAGWIPIGLTLLFLMRCHALAPAAPLNAK